MGFFAKIDTDNIVEDIVYVDSDTDKNANQYLEIVLGMQGPWVNGRLAQSSANYAEIGYVYVPEHNAFLPPKPHESWILDSIGSEFFWNSPVPYPSDEENTYVWDESSTSWKVSNP